MQDINDVRCYDNLWFLTFLLPSLLIILPPFITLFVILLLKFRTLPVFQQPTYRHRHHRQGVLPKGSSFTANSGIMAAVLPKDRSSTANSGTKVASSCGSFPLLSALQIVGILKITPHSYPWLEVDIGKIMCSLFRFSKCGNSNYSKSSRKLTEFIKITYCIVKIS